MLSNGVMKEKKTGISAKESEPNCKKSVGKISSSFPLILLVFPWILVRIEWVFGLSLIFVYIIGDNRMGTLMAALSFTCDVCVS
jgi:hypothetical protein